VLEREVTIPTKYGALPAFAACPSDAGPFPAVILYMDAPGIREELRNMARRIAKHGYYCLLPDLYYRLGTLRFDVSRRNDAMSAVIRSAMSGLTNAAVVDDTAGMISFLDGQEQVSSGPIGCVGHCMSGPFVATVAARFGRVMASAALYGIDMVTDRPDSPHRLAGQIKGEFYAAFAEIDPGVGPAVVPELKSTLERAGVRHRVDVLEGTHHGFCFAARNDYHAGAAEAVFGTIIEMFERNLNPSPRRSACP
jgi:carboxymethylenebutenolidase